ncbi:bifunctional 2-polyprenyl-6-hydroxyphenol methylase/3-demethylubiquinol 3-O-methyltransferase UbiG [Geothrix sp. 21YS21S-2]|uniref:class I SAM-dependent methyltransferase n=1 Tax=Geothrix sp. 21YS21S-2 TaxID=3068893 RepID=UPI0027BA36AB|nr:class I SAM-dependent methyltransferase [Geothrix sp. 21YS21S-2]
MRCSAPLAEPAWRCAACGWAAEVREGIPILYGEVPDGEGFSKAAFQDLAGQEARHFWFRSRNRLIAWALGRHAPRPGTFLEVGCGTGFVLQGLAALFPSTRFTGAEFHVEGLPFAAKRVPGADFLQLDARRLPFEAEFDVIGLFDVLEHIPEDDQVLVAVAAAVKPGGTVMVTVPQHPWLWSVVDEKASHVRRYTRAMLLDRLAGAGLRPVLATSFVSLLLPLLVQVRRRRDREAFEPLAEFEIAPWKNTLLALVMALERLLIKAGVRWPWGASLLVVARRPGP